LCFLPRTVVPGFLVWEVSLVGQNFLASHIAIFQPDDHVVAGSIILFVLMTTSELVVFFVVRHVVVYFISCY